jgi:hypothetical protein
MGFIDRVKDMGLGMKLFDFGADKKHGAADAQTAEIEQMTKRIRDAKFRLDCENSRGLVISLKNDLDALQHLADMQEAETVLYIAQKCGNNPIIACSNPERLPYGSLLHAQEKIMGKLKELYPDFETNPVVGLVNISKMHKIVEVSKICSEVSQFLTNIYK